MILALTKEQLVWILKGTRYGDKVRLMFEDHYVNGVGKTEAGTTQSLTQPFASKKFSEFDRLILEKCKTNNLKISTILHSKKDEKSVRSYDITKQPKGK